MRKMVFILLAAILGMTIMGCFLVPTYTVTYYPNGATSGSVPEDNNKYSSGELYYILDNTGDLKKDGYSFQGWNTKEDGTGVIYTSDINLNIEQSDIYLYAVWSDVDIYRCGTYGLQASYWKNNDRILLTDQYIYDAYGIYVDENDDIYIAGTKDSDDGTTRIPVYWKNGVENILPFEGDSSYAYSIAIDDDGNIYIAGSDFPTACYWKNGIEYRLCDNGAANEVYLHNGDIYFVGHEDQACYWKNGIQTELGDGYAYDIRIVGDDVYVFGLGSDGGFYVKYWKNETVNSFSIKSELGSTPKGSIDDNGDIYVVWTKGWYEDRSVIFQGMYWKNGDINYFSDLESYSAIDIEIVNGNRYILDDSRLWINDIPVYYTTKCSYTDFFLTSK